MLDLCIFFLISNVCEFRGLYYYAVVEREMRKHFMKGNRLYTFRPCQKSSFLQEAQLDLYSVKR